METTHRVKRLREPMEPFTPAYLGALADGTLSSRVAAGLDALRICSLCPRRCKADRSSDRWGVCRSGRRARVASWGHRFEEERCLTGQRGSGMIFFSSCNLACAFCKDADLSQRPAGDELEAPAIAAIMLELQALGCHNINLVTPSHVVPQILEALLIAAGAGLRIPIVYNSSGYEGPRALALLDGIVDIYLPDFKLWRRNRANRLLGAGNYPTAARRTLLEMHRQVGPLQVVDGIARRGVLVRHLVLPGHLDETAEIFRFISRKVSPDARVSILEGYRPAHRASGIPGLDRPLAPSELAGARELALAPGLCHLEN